MVEREANRVDDMSKCNMCQEEAELLVPCPCQDEEECTFMICLECQNMFFGLMS